MIHSRKAIWESFLFPLFFFLLLSLYETATQFVLVFMAERRKWERKTSFCLVFHLAIFVIREFTPKFEHEAFNNKDGLTWPIGERADLMAGLGIF